MVGVDQDSTSGYDGSAFMLYVVSACDDLGGDSFGSRRVDGKKDV